MMINPWFFYIMSVFGVTKDLSFGCAVLGSLCYLCLLVYVFVITYDDADEELLKMVKVIKKTVGWICIVSIIMAVAVPSEETLLLMQAAKLAAPENVDAIFAALKAAVDYAVSLFN